MTELAPPTSVDLSAVGSSAEVAAATHIGPVRSENQDDVAAVALATAGTAILLADGMGGQAGGGDAARAAIAAAASALAGGPASEEAAIAAVAAANAAVADLRDRLRGDPGTTLTLALVSGAAAVVAHAGDSRAYLVRQGVARLLTSDHSWVGEQVRSGALEPGAERRHPRRNVITNAVTGGAVVPEVLRHDLEAGDVLMLCSDGLWEPLDDGRIALLFGATRPLQDLVVEAVAEALDQGSSDNVTAIALRLPV